MTPFEQRMSTFPDVLITDQNEVLLDTEGDYSKERLFDEIREDDD